MSTLAGQAASGESSVPEDPMRSPELVCVVMVSIDRARFLEQKAVTHCCCAVVAAVARCEFQPDNRTPG